MNLTGIAESDSLKATLEEIAHQLRIANSLKKVELCYSMDDSYRREGMTLDVRQKLMNDLNNAIDMAFDS